MPLLEETVNKRLMEKYSFLMSIYYNDNPDYLSSALDSMIGQSYPADEIVLVKDGKIGEDLQKIIDEYEKKGINLVQVQIPENVGLGAALNEGLKHVRNDLTARMDADDICVPDRCKLQVKEFEKTPELDIISSPVLEFEGSIENIICERKVPVTNEEIYKCARIRDPFNHPAVMYRKKTVLAVGGYSDYRKNQDTDLWIKMLLNKAKCRNLEKPVLYFRFDDKTFARRKSFQCLNTLLEIRYNAWRSGFCSFGTFAMIAVMQTIKFIMPVKLQKLVRKNRILGL